MEPASFDAARFIGVIVGGLVMGAICGLAPLIAGNRRGYKSSGLAGFITCIVCGGILGALLALPVGLIWMGILLSRPRRTGFEGNPPPLSGPGNPPSF